MCITLLVPVSNIRLQALWPLTWMLSWGVWTLIEIWTSLPHYFFINILLLSLTSYLCDSKPTSHTHIIYSTAKQVEMWMEPVDYLRILEGGNFMNFVAMVLVPSEEKLSLVKTNEFRLKVDIIHVHVHNCCWISLCLSHHSILLSP